MGETCATSTTATAVQDTASVISSGIAAVPLISQQELNEPLAAEENVQEIPDNSAKLQEESNLIKYSIEYIGQKSGTLSIDGRGEKPDISKEPLVFEHVEVRLSSQDVLSAKVEEVLGTDKGKGRAYIKILSPVVSEALKCVVDYYPEIDFTQTIVKIHEPYSVFVFYEKELTEYRNRLTKASEDETMTCVNQWADKHIRIVQDFVWQHTRKAVEAERERHARGFATFDMLWLLFKPGQDLYLDFYDVGEHEPYVARSVDFDLVNGVTNLYKIHTWKLDGGSLWIGPVGCTTNIDRFSGEREIISLHVYPCEYLANSDDIDKDDLEKIREHFTRRGKKWHTLRREVRPYDFDGYTVDPPRRRYSSLSMIDSIQYVEWEGHPSSTRNPNFIILEHPVPSKICSCAQCEKVIYKHVAKPKFAGYEENNIRTVEALTDHQYFLCSSSIEAFLFKIRSWQVLHVDGFSEPSYDGALFERLVMSDSTKKLVKDLTQRYIRGSIGLPQKEEKVFTKISQVHRSTREKKMDTTWSADLIEGKGEGLTILLHGRPGVGKTYTVECIANYTERPLLSLTCSDIGVKPEEIEHNLLKWFKLAELWGVVMLIDEADIYMEQRQVQDVARNHLVAGFLRALEYYRGILFLTTNRVGTFDEAFISRIHVQIYYPDFEDAQRQRLWDTFFEKLEDDRESTMRISPAAKDYVQTQELRSLKWNGREIRNAFQVAVALAEAQNQTDKEGRVLIKPDHIKATVQMSKEFQEYLVKLHRGDLSTMASRMGHRYDAFDKKVEQTEKY